MKYILTICSLFITVIAFSQDDLNKAEKFFDQKAYTKAYNEYASNNQNISKNTLLQAAEASYLTKDYTRAVLYYRRAFNFNKGLDAPYI